MSINIDLYEVSYLYSLCHDLVVSSTVLNLTNVI